MAIDFGRAARGIATGYLTAKVADTAAQDELNREFILQARNQYFNNQPTPLVDDLYQSKLDKTFMGFPSYRQQELTGPDMGEYIGSGTDIPLEQTTAGKIQSGLGNIKDTASGIMSKIGGFGPISAILGSMDRFDTLSPADQEFIKQNMGYTGPTVFGENTSGLNKDPFGLNTRSAFGNYAERVGKEVDKLSAALGADGAIGGKKDFQGATFNPETGMFEAADDSDLTPEQIAALNKRTQLVRTKLNFYRGKKKERDEFREQEAQRIKDIMEGAVTLEVPNKVDYEFGKDWGSIK